MSGAIVCSMPGCNTSGGCQCQNRAGISGWFGQIQKDAAGSPTPPERITGVAIVDTQGRIWALPAPRRHCHIFALAAFLGDSAEGNMRGQGFMTSANRFVERAEALAIAKAAGQTRPGAKLGHQLYSEDLW